MMENKGPNLIIMTSSSKRTPYKFEVVDGTHFTLLGTMNNVTIPTIVDTSLVFKPLHIYMLEKVGWLEKVSY